MGFENFGGGSVGCLKITENKAYRRGPHVNSRVAFQFKCGCYTLANATRGSHSVPNAMVVLLFNTRTTGSRFNIKMQAYEASRFNTNGSITSFTFQLQREPVSSAFQHRCEYMSLAIHHQSKVRV